MSKENRIDLQKDRNASGRKFKALSRRHRNPKDAEGAMDLSCPRDAQSVLLALLAASAFLGISFFSDQLPSVTSCGSSRPSKDVETADLRWPRTFPLSGPGREPETSA
ncbi:hypothetical protein NDU88_003582 [Pleurodeles waltl]|uniref:Uncharacterized protein n=1 Tax=Pleurodeles waltl TaxID=8319 RepID=A0AAV7VI82_PLEWA|nr:hypothetical protein NDU88_003582 [Pleurodeles waltl]